MARTNGPRRGALRRWIAALFAGLFALVLLELGVRWLLPEFNPANGLILKRLQPGLPALGVPGTRARQVKNTGDYDVVVRFNRHGLRDARSIASAKPGDVMVLGDSFAFGWGVAEQKRFSSRLEALSGRRAFNVAAPGAGLTDYAALRAYAERLGGSADTVIIAVTMENDLRRLGSGDNRPMRSRPLGMGRIKRALQGCCATYRALTAAVHRTSWLREWAIGLGVIRPNLEAIGWLAPNRFDLASTLRGITKACESSRCIVALVPSRGLWVGPRMAATRVVHERLVEALAQEDLELVDLAPAMERAGQPLSFHFDHDGHWNERGHELAARELMAYLLR